MIAKCKAKNCPINPEACRRFTTPRATGAIRQHWVTFEDDEEGGCMNHVFHGRKYAKEGNKMRYAVNCPKCGKLVAEAELEEILVGMVQQCDCIPPNKINFLVLPEHVNEINS